MSLELQSEIDEEANERDIPGVVDVTGVAADRIHALVQEETDVGLKRRGHRTFVISTD